MEQHYNSKTPCAKKQPRYQGCIVRPTASPALISSIIRDVSKFPKFQDLKYSYTWKTPRKVMVKVPSWNSVLKVFTCPSTRKRRKQHPFSLSFSNLQLLGQKVCESGPSEPSLENLHKVAAQLKKASKRWCSQDSYNKDFSSQKLDQLLSSKTTQGRSIIK